MPQIPILNGLTSDANADWRSSYPINLIPVPKETGISKGSLRAAPGLTQLGTGPGMDRGGINWNDACYRVMGGSLVHVAADGTIAREIGAIAGNELVSMDYGPSYLCVVGGGNAYLCTPFAVTRITDSDIGTPIDVVWVDGYFFFTDGEFLYVNDLADPFAIDPLKYASSEMDPDRIVGVLKYRNEIYALNRYTIEVFDNIGGTGFPFTRLSAGLIPKGCVGTRAKTLFMDTFAWVGGGRNEPCSVYLAGGGSSVKVATREVELRLAAYSEAQLAQVQIEAKADRMHQHLIVHLPNETMVYDANASIAAGEPVWFFLSTGVSGVNPYRARNFTYCYGKWLVGDTQDARIGYVDETLCTQYGAIAGWQFDTLILYNDSKGAIVHSLELVGTSGRATFGTDPTVFTSYTVDGLNWSQEKQARIGSAGQTQQRVVWRQQGILRSFRSQRFRGANDCPISWARLQAEIEPLSA